MYLLADIVQKFDVVRERLSAVLKPRRRISTQQAQGASRLSPALTRHSGEYTVVDGFGAIAERQGISDRSGWTNGVILDLSARFGGQLQRPDCPPVVTSSGQPMRRLARRRLDFH